MTVAGYEPADVLGYEPADVIGEMLVEVLGYEAAEVEVPSSKLLTMLGMLVLDIRGGDAMTGGTNVASLALLLNSAYG